MQSNVLSYSLKIWLTSVILAPVIYLIIDSCSKTYSNLNLNDFIDQQIQAYMACTFFGAIFSVLTWVLYYLVMKVIMLFYPTAYIAKITFATLGALLTAGTFKLVLPETFNANDDFFPLMVANCICIASGALFYNLKLDGMPAI